MRAIWRPVVGFEGRYEVSAAGSVRSYVYGRDPSKPRRITGYINKWGYRRVRLTDGNGRRIERPVHQLVLEAFEGPRPGPWPAYEARHLDGNPLNNRWPSNLAWGTKLENADDRRRHGTHGNTKRKTCRRRGHLLVEPNLYEYDLERHGFRRCKACYLGANAVYKKRTKLDRDTYADQVYERLMAGRQVA